MVLAEETTTGAWIAMVVFIVVMICFLVFMQAYFRRDERKRDEERAASEAARDADHERQMAELAEEKRLRKLEDLRAALLRGRERVCAFCGVENGALTPQGVCTAVEECLARAGVPTPAHLH